MNAGADEPSANPFDADGLRKLVSEARARRAAATDTEREQVAREYITAMTEFAAGTTQPMLAARALCLAAEETEDILGRSDDAIALFEQSLRQNPALERAATQAEVLLQRLDRHEQRCSLLLERAKRLDENESNSEHARALAYRQAGAALVEANAEFGQAIDVYERAVELDPEVDTLEALADLYIKRNQPGDEEQAADILSSIADALSGGEAINFAQRALDLMPDHDEAMDLLARLVPEARHPLVLRARLEAYIELAGLDEDANPRRVLLARIYGVQGKLKEALACLSPAVEMKDPHALELRKQLLEDGIGGDSRGGGTLVGVPLQETEGGQDIDEAMPQTSEALFAAGMDFESEQTETGPLPPRDVDNGEGLPDTPQLEGKATTDAAMWLPPSAPPGPLGSPATKPPALARASSADAPSVEPTQALADPKAAGASESKADKEPQESRPPAGWPNSSIDRDPSQPEPMAPATESSAPSWPAPTSSAPPPTVAAAIPAEPKQRASSSSIHPSGDLASYPPAKANSPGGGLKLALIAAALMALAMAVTLLWPEDSRGTTEPAPVDPPAATASGRTAKDVAIATSSNLGAKSDPHAAINAATSAAKDSAEQSPSPPLGNPEKPSPATKLASKNARQPSLPTAQQRSEVTAGMEAERVPSAATQPITTARDGLSVAINPERVMIAGAPLDEAALLRGLAAVQGDLLACYQEARQRFPELHGRMVLLFLLAERKAKRASTTAGGTIKDYRLGRCLAATVDKAKLPLPTRHQTRIRLPIEFQAVE